MRSLPQLKKWKTEPESEVEAYITQPHQFLLDHQPQLLPDWQVSVAHLILFLQRSEVSLAESNQAAAHAKNILKARFEHWAEEVMQALQVQKYCCDFFDPQTGYPQNSQPGTLTLDDNAVVEASLNYPVVNYQNCSLIVHPRWQHHVYPAVIVTSAPIEPLEQLFADTIASL